MKFGKLKDNWNRFAETDPLWAILTDPGKKGNKWESEEFFRTGREHVDRLIGYLKSLNVEIGGSRALDFGCGVGRIAQALAPYFPYVTGVDISSSMIELAKRYNAHGTRCEYRANETDDLGMFRDGEFDFLCSFITLQHMDPSYSKKYIREFLRVLAPGGVMVFQLTAGAKTTSRFLLAHVLPRFIYAPVFRWIYRTDAVMEVHCVPRSSVIGVLEEGGAAVLDVKEDGSAGKEWLSYQYVSKKPNSPTR
jgi:SAM-dependent methyltransferase